MRGLSKILFYRTLTFIFFASLIWWTGCGGGSGGSSGTTSPVAANGQSTLTVVAHFGGAGTPTGTRQYDFQTTVTDPSGTILYQQDTIQAVQVDAQAVPVAQDVPIVTDVSTDTKTASNLLVVAAPTKSSDPGAELAIADKKIAAVAVVPLEAKRVERIELIEITSPTATIGDVFTAFVNLFSASLDGTGLGIQPAECTLFQVLGSFLGSFSSTTPVPTPAPAPTPTKVAREALTSTTDSGGTITGFIQTVITALSTNAGCQPTKPSEKTACPPDSQCTIGCTGDQVCDLSTCTCVAARSSCDSGIFCETTCSPGFDCNNGCCVLNGKQTCGNCIREGSEQCDDPSGGSCYDQATGKNGLCNPDCTCDLIRSTCSDFFVTGNEKCDPPGSTCYDPNLNKQGICSSDCMTCDTTASTCGDFTITGNEACDPPGGLCYDNKSGLNGFCNGSCTTCDTTKPVCGDGLVTGNEVCDPKAGSCYDSKTGHVGFCVDNGNCDTCDGTQKICGDGLVTADEVCDPGPQGNNTCFDPSSGKDGLCTSNCSKCDPTAYVCGDGVRTGPEVCDTLYGLGCYNPAENKQGVCSKDCLTCDTSKGICGDLNNGGTITNYPVTCGAPGTYCWVQTGPGKGEGMGGICNSDCTVCDTTVQQCGDGFATGTEKCDPPGGLCWDFQTGTPGLCNDTCQCDTSNACGAITKEKI